MVHAIAALVSAQAQAVVKVIPDGFMNRAPFVLVNERVKTSVLVTIDPGMNPKVTIP